MNTLLNLFGSSPEKKFWRWFQENSETIFKTVTGREPILDELEHQLKSIHEDLVFEVGPVLDKGKRELVISADGIKRAFPAVQELVAAAPKYSKWQITGFRQPMPERPKIRMEGYELSYDEIWFSHQRNEDGQREDLVLYIKDFAPENEKMAAMASFILLDSLVGEYVTATRIGAIERKPLLDNPESNGLRPFSEIRDLVA